MNDAPTSASPTVTDRLYSQAKAPVIEYDAVHEHENKPCFRSNEIELEPSEVEFLEKLKEDREVNLFVSESTAYARMKSKGLCKRGVIPNFYGMIRNIQPTVWPNLDMFLNDRLPPNAILIEYIPNLQSIDLSNFSEERLARLLQILNDIHKADVLHGDPMPRNMMVSLGGQGRVLWIDFDSAQTFSEGEFSPRQEELIKEEVEMMDYFVEALAQD